MWFDLAKLAPRDGYKILTSTIVPRPIAWIVSADEQGRLNAAPFSFFNLFSDDPPIVCVGITGRAGGQKDTAANIRARQEFVINLVPEGLAQHMNVTSAEYAPEVDELAQAGLSVLPSTTVSVPRIAQSPGALECVPVNYMDLGQGRVIIAARVQGVHVSDDAVLDPAKCYIDTPALKLVARMHGRDEYARTSDLFTMERHSVPA